MIRALVLAALLLAGNAQAQTAIGKCVDVKGHVNYTTHGCEPGEKLVDVKVYGAVHDDPAAAAKVRHDAQILAERKRASNNDRTFYVPRNTAPSERELQRQRCNAAREAARNARGKGFDSSYLIQLDRAAADACFGL